MHLVIIWLYFSSCNNMYLLYKFSEQSDYIDRELIMITLVTLSLILQVQVCHSTRMFKIFLQVKFDYDEQNENFMGKT